MALIQLENGTWVDVPDTPPAPLPNTPPASQGVRSALDADLVRNVTRYQGQQLHTGWNPMNTAAGVDWQTGDVPPRQPQPNPRALTPDLSGPEHIRRFAPTLQAAQANAPRGFTTTFNTNLRDALARELNPPQRDMFGGYDPDLAQRPGPTRAAAESGWQGGLNRWSDLQEAARRGTVYGDVSRNQQFDFRSQAELDAEAAAQREAWRKTNKPVAEAAAGELKQAQADVRAARTPPAGEAPPAPAEPRRSLLDRVLNRSGQAAEQSPKRSMADRVAGWRGEPGAGKSPGERLSAWRTQRAEARAARPKVGLKTRVDKGISTMGKGGAQLVYGLLLDSALRQDTPYNLANAQTVDDVVRIKGATDAERKAAYDAEVARANREGGAYRPPNVTLAQERYGLQGENQGRETKLGRQANLASDYILAHQFDTFQLMKSNPELYDELDTNEQRLMDDATRYVNNPTLIAGMLNTGVGAGRSLADLGRVIGEGAGWVAEQGRKVDVGGAQASLIPPGMQQAGAPAGPPRNTQPAATDAMLDEAIRADEINRAQGRPDASPGRTPASAVAAPGAADEYTQNLAREVGGDAAKLTPVKGLKGIYRTTGEFGEPVFVGGSDRAKKAATDPATRQQMDEDRYREGLRQAFNTEKYLAALQGKPFETNLADYMSGRGALPTEADMNVEQRKLAAEAQKMNAEAYAERATAGQPTPEQVLSGQRFALDMIKTMFPNDETGQQVQQLYKKYGHITPDKLPVMLNAESVIRDLTTTNTPWYAPQLLSDAIDWFGATPDTWTAEQTYDFTSRLAKAVAQNKKEFVDEKANKTFRLSKLTEASKAKLRQFDANASQS